MTLTHAHTNGTAVASSCAWLAERVRPIDPDRQYRFEGYLREILGSLGMDLNTPGTAETPRRFLQALIDATDGYEGDPKLVTVFPTECHGGASCELAQIVEGPFYALCEHHALPFFGMAYVGYVAHDQIIGISKLTRLVRVLTRRFGVQERMTHQIAESLAELLQAHGVAVYMEADHLCTQMRGVRENNATTRTTAYRGVYEKDADLRGEFFAVAGISAQALNLGTALPTVLSVAAFAGAFVSQWRYQIRVLAAGTGLAPEFPRPGDRQARSETTIG